MLPRAQSFGRLAQANFKAFVARFFLGIVLSSGVMPGISICAVSMSVSGIIG
jgi:hypothetical protein